MSLATVADPDRDDSLTVSLFVDRGGLAALSDVVAQPADAWSSTSGRAPNLGFTRDVAWLQVALPEWREGERVLEVGDPLLQRLDVYVFARTGERIAEFSMGTARAFQDRPQRSPFFSVPLPPGASHGSVLVRAQSDTAVQVPVALWTRDAFEERLQALTLRNGMYIGVAATLLCFGLIMFLAVRDRAFLWYSAWVASASLVILTLNGLSFQWIWPQNPDWNRVGLPLSLSLATVVSCGFFTSFLREGGRPGLGDQVINQLAGLLAALSAATIWLPYQIAIGLVILIALSINLLFMVFAAIRAFHGSLEAQYFLFAFSFVTTGCAVAALTRVGVLALVPLTEIAPQLGAALTMLSLSLALAARAHNELRLLNASQAEQMAAQIRQKMELEARVHERTQALELANQRLEIISRTDVLTGLANRRHLDECLHDEMRRARRSGRGVGLLLMDVDHFKCINDAHGHQVGDVCLRVLADVLRAASRRGGDLVARYGGEEFCIVVPDGCQEGCVRFAESIRQQIERTEVHCGELSLRMTISIGVAWRRGSDDLSSSALLCSADRALYDAKAAGRNRVSVA